MNSKTVNKIASVIIALLLWVYVIGEINPITQVTVTDIPVTLTSEETLAGRGLAITGDSAYTVDIVLEGKRSDVIEFKEDSITASANLLGFGKGENYIHVSAKLTDAVINSLEIIEVRPARIPVNVEELVTVGKPVVISVNGLGETAEAGDIETKPMEISVSGARSQVNAVHHIQVNVDGTKLLENGNALQGMAVPVDSGGVPVDNVKLSAQYVEVSAKLYHLKEVELKANLVNQLPRGLEIDYIDVPKVIKIKGTKAALKNLTEVQTEPMDLSAITSNVRVPITIDLPEGVELAQENEAPEAKIVLRDIASKTFTYSANEILAEGLPEGFLVSIMTPSITLEVSGNPNIVGALEKSELIPRIALGEADTGTVTATVIVDYKAELSGVLVTPEIVDITISEAP